MTIRQNFRRSKASSAQRDQVQNTANLFASSSTYMYLYPHTPRMFFFLALITLAQTATTKNSSGGPLLKGDGGPIVIKTRTFSLSIEPTTCLCTTIYHHSTNSGGAGIVSDPVPFLSFYNRVADARDSNLDSCTSASLVSVTGANNTNINNINNNSSGGSSATIRVVAPHSAGSVDITVAAKDGGPHILFEVASISRWTGADPVEKYGCYF